VFWAQGGHGVYGLCGTGADGLVFPGRGAAILGVDLTKAARGNSSGVNRGSFPVRYAEVGRRLYNPGEQRDWRTWVAFTPVRLRRPLLGHAGFLEYFEAHFRDWRRELELAVAPPYPGT